MPAAIPTWWPSAARGIGKRAAAAPEPVRAAAGEASRRNRVSRRGASSSFADQHALKTLPGKIDALHGEIRRLEGVLADAELYARDPQAFAAAGAALERAQAEMAEAEEAWLSAELRREEIEGS